MKNKISSYKKLKSQVKNLQKENVILKQYIDGRLAFMDSLILKKQIGIAFELEDAIWK